MDKVVFTLIDKIVVFGNMITSQRKYRVQLRLYIDILAGCTCHQTEIFHHKPNGLHYFHLKQLKHITEWQLAGTFQQKQKNTMRRKRNTSPPINIFFGWLFLMLFNMFQVPRKELERKSSVVSVVFEGRQCTKDS